MKAHAEVTFKGELTELTQEEAYLIRDAVRLVAMMEKEDAEEYEISREQSTLANKLYAELRVVFRESNWRE